MRNEGTGSLMCHCFSVKTIKHVPLGVGAATYQSVTVSEFTESHCAAATSRECLQFGAFVMTEHSVLHFLFIIITQQLKTCICYGNKLDIQKNNKHLAPRQTEQPCLHNSCCVVLLFTSCFIYTVHTHTGQRI